MQATPSIKALDMNTIIDYLHYWTKKQPNKTLFHFLDLHGHTKESYTYQQFENRVETIASHLRDTTTLKRGDTVILLYPPGLEIICAFFACAKIGLIPVPVAPPTEHQFYAALKRMNYIIADSEAKAILSTQKYHWFFKLNLAKQQFSYFLSRKNIKPSIQWIKTDDFLIRPKKPVPDTPFDFLFLQYTSGSTNQPKGVMVSHQNVLSNAEATTYPFDIGVTWLPQFHDMGLIGYYFFILIKGGTTYGFSPLDFIKRPVLWLETISKVKATVTSVPNFALAYCMRKDKLATTDLESLQLNSLRVLMIAAEPVRAETFIRFFQQFKALGLKQQALSAAYGLAENTIAVSMYGHKILSINRTLFLKKQVAIEPFSMESRHISNIVSCGKPIKGVNVKIVNPDTQQELESGKIGEVWITGTSKCLGYWKKENLSKKSFEATMIEKSPSNLTYLRTGDLGFLQEEELYICGRIKDMIIVRGANFYPQDIEKVMEESAPEIRKGATVCFGFEKEQEEKLVVLMEVKNAKKIPQPSKIVKDIRINFNIVPYLIAFLPPHTLAKTSSGKIARIFCKEQWLSGTMPSLATFYPEKESLAHGIDAESPFEKLKQKYQLTGKEDCTLFEAGLDSLSMVELIGNMKDLLIMRGASHLAKDLDTRIFHHLTIAHLFDFAQHLTTSPNTAIKIFEGHLRTLKQEHLNYENMLMRRDTQLPLAAKALNYPPASSDDPILLTGVTGFLGGFLLESLLAQTTGNIYVLIRANHQQHAITRLHESLKSNKILQAPLYQAFAQRVIPVCGDLSLPNLGWSANTWTQLAKTIRVIYHNGALVNYLLGYEDLRAANVLGTQTLIQFAFTEHPKVFNHISTTFIFGWSVQSTLSEHQNNQHMESLDFGYSQTKWVSEQLVLNALKKGLKARIFRPALIAPSTKGGGYHFDIAMRLFAFIINHQISATAKNQMSLVPVDIVAHNIVAIGNLPSFIGQTFHVTADDYYNLGDFTHQLRLTLQKEFSYKNIPAFTEELKRRCTPQDLLYPLLDFFIRSSEHISDMEFKRYNSDNYKLAKLTSTESKPDVSLAMIVKGIVKFLVEQGAIEGSVQPEQADYLTIMKKME